MEIWKDVVGYEGEYKVSNKGRVKKLQSDVEEKILNLSNHSHGYKIASMKGKRKYVHRLVAKAFIPNPKNKPEVNHKDLNPSNNHTTNLEWVTHQENVIHAYKNLTITFPSRKGEKHPGSILTKKEVLEIRAHAEKNGKYYGRKALSEKYNVAEITIQKIVNRRLWTHI